MPGEPEALVRLILDTNVVLSALLWRGAPNRLLNAIRMHDGIKLFSSDMLLENLADVMLRPMAIKRLVSIGWNARQLLADYIEIVDLVAPRTDPRVVAGERDDDHVVAAEVEAMAGFIISGDRHLLALGDHQGIRIINPAAGLLMIEGP